jgi:hypothetical protein
MIKTLRVILASIILCCAPRFAAAQGGPPLVTDDPETVGDGRWEINTAFTMEKIPGQKTMQVPDLDINYGYGDSLQFKYEVSALMVREDDVHHSGAGNSFTGVKWRFLDGGDEGLSLSTYPTIEFNTPPGSSRPELVEHGTNFFLPLEWSKQFGGLELAGDFGYQFTQHRRDEILGGVAAGHKFTERFELLGEIRVSTTENFHDTDVFFNIGERLQITEHAALIVSSGRSFKSGPDSAHFLLYAGFSISD